MKENNKFTLGWRGFVLLALLSAMQLLVVASAHAEQPVVESQDATNVTTDGATLEAVIGPNADESGAWVQFQLATDPAALWPEITCPEPPEDGSEPQCLGPYGVVGGPPPLASIQRRPGDLPTERLLGASEPSAVSLALNSLQPGTTYYYRLVAAESPATVDNIVWRSPPTYGPVQTFATPSLVLAAPPVTTVPPPPSTPPQGRGGKNPGGQTARSCRQRRVKSPLRRLGFISCRRAVR